MSLNLTGLKGFLAFLEESNINESESDDEDGEGVTKLLRSFLLSIPGRLVIVLGPVCIIVPSYFKSS